MCTFKVLLSNLSHNIDYAVQRNNLKSGEKISMFIQEHKNLWKYGASLGALVDYVSYMIGSLRYISQLTKLTSYIDKEDIILD